MDSELSSPGPRTFQGITRTPCDITIRCIGVLMCSSMLWYNIAVRCISVQYVSQFFNI